MTGTAAQLRGMRDLAVQIMHERDPDALHTLVLTELLRACHAEAAVCKEADWQPDEGAVSIVTAPAARSVFDHPQASRLIRIGVRRALRLDGRLRPSAGGCAGPSPAPA
ncbi:hypothetical protein [Streptomyces sp. NPDC087538]|uniref:hypothetical protein n=1 Tax=Streptomyces sp. NPDC087538 TaxID=3365797 RepID=UPI0038137F8B